MKKDEELLQEIKKIMMIRYPRFAQEIANANLKFNSNLRYKTAATDGNNIYFDPDFFKSLNDEERLFLIAHELMHIKFQHMFRMTDENGNKREAHIWNIATDAIINANLARDGFTIKEGFINIPQALQFNSEDLYIKLLEEKRKQQNKANSNDQCDEDQDGESQDGEGQSGKEQRKKAKNGQGESQDNFGDVMDDHTLWKKAFEEQENAGKSEQETADSKGKDNTTSSDFDEASEFEKNRQEREAIAKKFIEGLKEKGLGLGNIAQTFDNLGKATPVADWKVILRREIEKTETLWTQRRSIAENNFAYRLEENDLDDEALTEVMIDTSGSVDDNLVMTFLAQLKPLLQNSKLKVGCFDGRFYGFKEIKTERDIKNFEIVGRGGTNFEEAVRNFSDKGEVNKIVFTDGYDTMNLSDRKYANIIWIVYENQKFKPAVGKVIYVNKTQIKGKNCIDENNF